MDKLSFISFASRRPGLLAAFCGAVLLCTACKCSDGWELVWEEEFNGDELDSAVWQRIPRGQPDWQNTQDDTDPRLVRLEDGRLILSGIVNDDPSDPAPFITGGIWTRDLKAIPAGRIEVCAKMGDAKGAWPAIWTMGYDYRRYSWPYGGEIDICERLNGEDFAYQTVHSPYTRKHGNLKHQATGKIKNGEFNVYSVDIYRDSLVMHINGIPTFTYLKDPELPEDEWQFPYFRDQYLLIDMQLGGEWVGETDAEDLPVTMEVDWVRAYVRKDS